MIKHGGGGGGGEQPQADGEGDGGGEGLVLGQGSPYPDDARVKTDMPEVCHRSGHLAAEHGKSPGHTRNPGVLTFRV